MFAKSNASNKTEDDISVVGRAAAKGLFQRNTLQQESPYTVNS